MRAPRRSVGSLLSLSLLAGAGCIAVPPGDPEYEKSDDLDGDGKADSSVEATILDFEWETEMLTDWATESSARQTIQDQLLYTIGHLNGDRAVGRLDRLDLTNVQVSPAGSQTRIAYHAKMPVAWGSKTDLPSTYAFTLPRDASYAGQESFTTKYKESCVDWGAHEVDSGSMWYYYRPNNSGCTLADGDVVKTTARVTVSKVNTTGKFPEYHKVWEDHALNVVSVFGKYEDGATTSSDAGISAFNEFVAAVKSALAPYAPTTVPADVPASPGVSAPDITFTATLPSGDTIQVNALLVDKVSTAPESFYTRYEALSTHADLIAYNGHAGLGQNVRALAHRGHFVSGQYLIVFMNGCDTFAYVDGSLAETRAAVNPDDPSGTKYMDIVTNAMPAYFASDAGATMALMKGLLNRDAPLTYEQMFRNIDRSQVVLVTGEQDNVYVPGFMGGGGPAPPAWMGLSDSGAVAKGEEKRWQTPSLPAGKYLFQISGTGGDADLYVRIGSAPTIKTFDCRPYKTGSNESCVVDLPTPASAYVMVRGYSANSSFQLVGRPQ